MANKIKITYELCQQFAFKQISDIEKQGSGSSRILLDQQKKHAKRKTEFHGGMNNKTAIIEGIQGLKKIVKNYSLRAFDCRLARFATTTRSHVRYGDRICPLPYRGALRRISQRGAGNKGIDRTLRLPISTGRAQR